MTGIAAVRTANQRPGGQFACRHNEVVDTCGLSPISGRRSNVRSRVLRRVLRLSLSWSHPKNPRRYRELKYCTGWTVAMIIPNRSGRRLRTRTMPRSARRRPQRVLPARTGRSTIRPATAPPALPTCSAMPAASRPAPRAPRAQARGLRACPRSAAVAISSRPARRDPATHLQSSRTLRFAMGISGTAARGASRAPCGVLA
jgi:hypothetical protein